MYAGVLIHHVLVRGRSTKSIRCCLMIKMTCRQPFSSSLATSIDIKGLSDQHAEPYFSTKILRMSLGSSTHHPTRFFCFAAFSISHHNEHPGHADIVGTETISYPNLDWAPRQILRTSGRASTSDPDNDSGC